MDSISEPLVSVVTPFYNTEQYLEECIQSVLSQSYQNFEYILVNNCSTDGSKQIAEKYARSDSRIRLIQEVEFVGQVENYNRALRYIAPQSKYCKLVQADDWIYPRCLEEMVAVAEWSDNVGLISSFSLYEDHLGHEGLPMALGPVYSGRETGKVQLLGHGIFGSATCVMYRSDVVRSRAEFFSTRVRYFEDLEVCFEILQNHDFGFVPQVLSFNRRDYESTWARIERYGGLALSDVMFVHRFGRSFLNRDEFSYRVQETERVFYDWLARSILRGFVGDFWRFHVEGMASVGLKISYIRLVLHVFLFLADAALNPKRSVETLWRIAKREG